MQYQTHEMLQKTQKSNNNFYKQIAIYISNQPNHKTQKSTILAKTTQTQGAFTDISLDNSKSRHYETTMALICQSFHRLCPLLPCGKPKFQNLLSLTFHISDFFFFNQRSMMLRMMGHEGWICEEEFPSLSNQA